jgi:chromate transporter
MIAISESTPGALGANMASYTGFQCAEIPGAVIATLGLISPSIIVIIIVAKLLLSYKENALVQAAFSGLRPAASGLIAAAGFGIIRLSLYNEAASAWYEILRWREAILFAVLFLLIRTLRKHPVVYIAAAGIVGIVLRL